jgi:uncharacterized membrane protein HdeD (DUF308 family)
MVEQNSLKVEKPGLPWWLVLLEGIAAIILGWFLLTRPAATLIIMIQFLGIYWFVTGIFSIISLLWNRSHWFWKLVSGILGIIAGILIIQNPLWSTLLVPVTLAIILGAIGLVIGFMQLIEAFRGGGWGLGILGLLSILLGFLLITRPVIAGLALPWVLGVLLIGGGILAIIGAFMIRSARRQLEQSRSQPVQAVRGEAVVAATGSPVAPVETLDDRGTTAGARESVAGAGSWPAAASTGAAAAGAAAAGAAGLAAAGSDSVEETGEELADQAGETSELAGADEAAAGAGWPAVGSAEAAAARTAAAAGAAGLAAAGSDSVEETGEELAEQAGETSELAGESFQSAGTAVEGPDMGAIASAGAVGEEVAHTADEAGLAVEGTTGELSDSDLLGNIDSTNPEEMAKFKHPLEYVEGIGPVYAGQLGSIGLLTCLDLLKAGATRKGREEVANRSGISGSLILEWVNHVDLYRVRGVGSEYADLLEEAGVDTVVELAQRNPGHLYDKMNEVNAGKQLVRRLPTTAQVEDWVTQAKGLPRLVTY